MAETSSVKSGENQLLTSKWGPLPVWAWGAIGVLAAWLWSKYRDLKSQAASASQNQTDVASATGQDSEGQAVAPQFIIENNMPAGVGAPTTPSAPISTLPGVPPVVVTPPGTGSKPPTTTPKPPVISKPTGKKPIAYKVKHGDTLSAIAARYHTTWQKLWTYNTTAGNRPADTIATLKKRGPNLLFANETILIPQS